MSQAPGDVALEPSRPHPLGRARALVERLPVALILLALLVMPFVLWPGMMYSYWTLKRTFAEALGLVLAGAVLCRALVVARARVRLGSIELAALAYALYVVAGFVFFQGYEGFAVKAGVLLGLTFLSVVLAQEVAREGESLAGRVVTCIWASGLLVSLHGLMQFVGVDPLLENRFGFFAKTNVFGPLGNPNVCGGFLAAAYPFALLKVTQRRGVLSIGGLVLLLATALLTESRGAWTGMALATLVFFSGHVRRAWGALRRRPGLLAGGLAGVVGAVGALAVVLFRLNPESSLGRVAVWRIAWLMFLDSPLVGIGFRSIPNTYPTYQARLFARPGGERYLDFATFNTHAHNDVLEVLAETGLLGLLLFTLLAVAMFRTCARLVRTGEGATRSLALALAASAAAVLMHGQFDCPLYAPPIQLIFLAAAGVLAGLEHHRREASARPLLEFESRLAWPPWMRGAAALAVGAVIILHGQRLAHGAAGYVYWKRGDLLLPAEDSSTNLLIGLAVRPEGAGPLGAARRQQLQAAVDAYQRAVERLPERGQLRLQLALVLAELDQPREALEQLRLAVPTYPDWEVFSALGLLTERVTRDVPRAEALYREALAINPRLLLPRYLLGRMYLRAGAPARAIAVLEEARRVEVKADSAQVRVTRAAIQGLLASIRSGAAPEPSPGSP